MMGFGVIYMLVFWLAVIGLAIWLLSRLFPGGVNDVTSHPATRNNSRPESPLEILKRRYAQGEISQEEYEEIHRDLSE